ncbi:MAG TPA: DUF4388 domain-containing protein [Polyangiaceae bacterium]|nr:DUF4388 domain-containing protein [Polyangiaceae bacterium]
MKNGLHIAADEPLRRSVLAWRRSARDALDAVLASIVELCGHDAKACCRRELTGLIEDLSLTDLLQMVAMGRRSALIEVRAAAATGRIWCSDGEIIDASTGSLTGTQAVYRLLALEDGDLCADFRPPPRRRLIREEMRVLVMEAARRKDECAELQRRLGGAGVVWWTSPSGPGDGRDGTESAVLEGFAQGARLERVLADNAAGDLETLRAMAQLALRGAIHPRPTLPPCATAAPPRRRSRSRRWIRAAAARLEQHPRTVAAALLLGSSSILLGALALRAADAGDEGPAVEAVSATQAELGTPQAAPFESITYPLRVRVEPDAAALWLDGRRVGTGELALDLARDGRTHELRVMAPGCRSLTFLFQDRSPPRAISLEPEAKAASSGAALEPSLCPRETPAATRASERR